MENVSNINQLDWSVFDERDPIQHAQKVMGYFGTNFGFRGGEEHVKLERKHIERGVSPLVTNGLTRTSGVFKTCLTRPTS